MANAKFSVKATGASDSKTIVEARNFKIIVDEPENLGGTDEGANPVEYVLAALAGCLNVVGHMIAREMEFDLKGIKIDLEGELNPAKLMGENVDTRAGYNAIKVRITPDANVDRKTLETWLEKIDERCPVSDNISNTTPVNFTLAL